MEITINQNDNQLIRIGNSNIQDINITEDENQEIGINNITPQSLNVSQPETQTILIDGGGAVIGITNVLVNGVTVVSGNIAYITVPTKTSELINNSGFITSETDPTVPSVVKQITLADINNWNSKQNALVSGSNIKTINNTSLLGSGNIDISGGESYTAGNGINIENGIISNTITNYNDLTDLPTIPNKTSDLINDSNFVSEEKLAEVSFTGSYNSLSDTPIIPDSTSDLINDSNFITSQEVSTEIQTAIATKQDKLVSGTNIKTINNNSLLGSGNINISQPTKTSDLTNDGNGTYPFMLNKDISHIDGIGTYGGSSAYANNLSYVYTSGGNSEIKLVANFDDIPVIPTTNIIDVSTVYQQTITWANAWDFQPIPLTQTKTNIGNFINNNGVITVPSGVYKIKAHFNFCFYNYQLPTQYSIWLYVNGNQTRFLNMCIYGNSVSIPTTTNEVILNVNPGDTIEIRVQAGASGTLQINDTTNLILESIN